MSVTITRGRPHHWKSLRMNGLAAAVSRRECTRMIEDHGAGCHIARRKRNERRISLREIDRLKIAGTYDAIRAALAADPAMEVAAATRHATASHAQGTNPASECKRHSWARMKLRE